MTLRLIGIGGLGKMLGPSATHLKANKAAIYLRMYDRGTSGNFRDACRIAWRQAGTTLVSTYKELIGDGDFDGLLICAGKNGDDYKIIKEIISLLKKNQKKYFILHFSTVSCEFVRATFKFCETHDVYYANYPLTGGAKGAVSAKMLILASGNKDFYNRLLPMLQAIGVPNYFGEDIARAAAIKFIGHVMVFHGLLGISLATILQKNIFNFSTLNAEQIEFFDFLNNGSGGTKQWDVTLRPALQNNNWCDGFLVKHAVVDAIYTAELLIENNIPLSLLLPLLEVALLFTYLLKNTQEKELATAAIAELIAKEPITIQDFIAKNLFLDSRACLKNCVALLPEESQRSLMLEVTY